MTRTITIAAVLLAVTAAEAQTRITTQLFDERGNRIGMATEVGRTTTFYDARGNKTGSSTTTGRTTIYYDARGNKTGSTTATKR
jgi:YD repeat-containing protein